MRHFGALMLNQGIKEVADIIKPSNVLHADRSFHLVKMHVNSYQPQSFYMKTNSLNRSNGTGKKRGVGDIFTGPGMVRDCCAILWTAQLCKDPAFQRISAPSIDWHSVISLSGAGIELKGRNPWRLGAWGEMPGSQQALVFLIESGQKKICHFLVHYLGDF